MSKTYGSITAPVTKLLRAVRERGWKGMATQLYTVSDLTNRLYRPSSATSSVVLSRFRKLIVFYLISVNNLIDIMLLKFTLFPNFTLCLAFFALCLSMAAVRCTSSTFSCFASLF